MPVPAASATKARPVAALRAASRSAEQSAGRSPVRTARRVDRPATSSAPNRRAAFSPAPGSGATFAPISRTASATTGSSVTTINSATEVALNTAVAVSRTIASTSSGCRSAGTAPRSRLFAASSPFTGMTVIHCRLTTQQVCSTPGAIALRGGTPGDR